MPSNRIWRSDRILYYSHDEAAEQEQPNPRIGNEEYS